jgi:hypothetical protein
MKTQCPSFLPSSHLYSTSVGPSWATLLIYPPFYWLLPPVLGNSQGYFPLPPMGRVLGSWDVILDDPSSSLYIFSSTRTLAPSSYTGGDFSIYYTYRFYSVSVYQPSIDIPFYHRTNSWHSILVLSSAFLSSSPSYFLVSCVY